MAIEFLAPQTDLSYSSAAPIIPGAQQGVSDASMVWRQELGPDSLSSPESASNERAICASPFGSHSPDHIPEAWRSRAPIWNGGGTLLDVSALSLEADQFIDCTNANTQEGRAGQEYTEEMKFFIMYLRLIRGCKWDEITRRFQLEFHVSRSTTGLTSVYYRIRREYGLEKVLDGGRRARSDEDVRKLHEKAREMPDQLLRRIGYLDAEES